MLNSILECWGRIEFDFIILDYFFTPAGYARDRWADKFYEITLPQLLESGVLKSRGSIFLPRLQCVEESLEAFSKKLFRYYEVIPCSAESNPLFNATELVVERLLLCPDKIINDTQMRPLLKISDLPFISLKSKLAPHVGAR